VRPFIFEKRTPPRSHGHQQGFRCFHTFTLPRLHLSPQHRPAAHCRHRQVPALLTTTSQPGSATNLVDPWSHVTGSIDAPPFVEGCGRLNSPTTPLPQRQHHNFDSVNDNDNDNIMLSAPPPLVECHVSKKEGTRRREWGNTRQQNPYCCPRYAHALLQVHLHR
jgi:hypothetical protein